MSVTPMGDEMPASAGLVGKCQRRPLSAGALVGWVASVAQIVKAARAAPVRHGSCERAQLRPAMSRHPSDVSIWLRQRRSGGTARANGPNLSSARATIKLSVMDATLGCEYQLE